MEEDFLVKEQEVKELAVSALKKCLGRVPEARVENARYDVPVSQDLTIDMVVRVRLRGEHRTLVAEVKANGQPRRAREAIWQLRKILEQTRYADASALFIAPSVSETTARMCLEAGIGYLDLAGNCLINVPGLFIERSGADAGYKEKRATVSIFSPKSSRVLRVLLSDVQRTWQVQRLAATAHVSLGLASKVKQALADREWIAATATGVRLSRPEELLDAWAESYTYRKNAAVDFYSLDGPAETESAIAAYCAERGIDYALTGFSGARLTAPRVRYARATVYVANGVDALAASVGFKRVETGANVLLLKPYDEGIYYGAVQRFGLRVVSPIQLYLDLRSMAGRADEAADELLQREIRPGW